MRVSFFPFTTLTLFLACYFPAVHAADDWYRPPVSVTWQWQLDGEINENYPVDLYNIDLFDSPVKLVQRLQTSGKKVICYFSAGSFEDWRPDASKFKQKDLGKTLSGWPDEKWLDIRSKSVRSIMLARLDLAAEKGCNGVEPDNVDGHRQFTSFPLRAYHQLNYNTFLAKEAHKRGLAIGLKNNLGQVRSLVKYFDFAVNEQCFEYSECNSLDVFIENGKPVLNAEYRKIYVDDPDERADICKESLDQQLSTLILPVELNDGFRLSCQS